VLAAIALTALAVSLLLAFASTTALRPDANGDAASRPTLEPRFAAPPAPLHALPTAAGADAEHGNDAGGAAGNAPSRPPLLWALLAPWAFAVDAIALLGLAAVLFVRYNARRRRGARM
jgi:hypothetical protein